MLEARDGLEALEILRALDGDELVVLADYLMPRMDGEELLQALMRDASLADRRAFALMTACAAWLPSPLRALLAERQIPVLAKPFQLAELEDVVRRARPAGDVAPPGQ